MNTRKVKQPKGQAELIYEASPREQLVFHGASIQSMVRKKYSNATRVSN